MPDPSEALLLFQCQDDPGMCDEWEADSGGNAAIRVRTEGRVPMKVPRGETQLPGVSLLRFVPIDGTDQEAYVAAVDGDRATLGRLGGAPLWLQTDQTPTCSCGQKMLLAAMLENRGGGGINFGDAGTGYAFYCLHCPTEARFLYQCG